MNGGTGTVTPGRDSYSHPGGLRDGTGARLALARLRSAGVAWPLFTGLGPVGALPTAPRLARMFTEMTLRGWGLAAVEDTAILIVSELTTNVVRAASGPEGSPRYDSDGRLPVCWLRLMADAVLLGVEVWDNLPTARGAPAPRQAAPEEESGRGLSIVEALSLAWGFQPVPALRAKSTWAVLAITTEGNRPA